MKRYLKKYFTDLHDWAEQLRDSDKVIVVEGIEDKKSIESLGISHVVQLNKKPLYKIVEELAEETKEVIILTDLDKKGKELYGRLNHDLQRFGVKVDRKFREFLWKETRLRQIEGIVNYLRRH